MLDVFGCKRQMNSLNTAKLISKLTARNTRVSVAGALIALLTFGGASAVALEDIYTNYSSEKNGCNGSVDALISLTQNSISGAGFSCVLSNSTPAGSGLSNYDGACIIDGAKVSDSVTFDMGNYSDRFEVALPKREGWLPMYPCTPVQHLQN